jgi:hypothetical protein
MTIHDRHHQRIYNIVDIVAKSMPKYTVADDIQIICVLGDRTNVRGL